jgi:hypothetical protein
MGKSMTELLQHPLVEAARDYAIRAHAETNHLYDGRPYAVHLSMVVERAVEFLHLLEETDRPTALAGIRACEVATFVKICDRLANAGHSVATKSRMQDVYRRELAEFRAALYSDRFAPMWAALEQLLAG